MHLLKMELLGRRLPFTLYQGNARRLRGNKNAMITLVYVLGRVTTLNQFLLREAELSGNIRNVSATM